MKKNFLALLTLTIIGASCNKAKQELITSPVANNGIKKTRTLTGGNGNGTEYNRDYEIHEKDGTISCIAKGDNCRVKAISSNAYTQIDNIRSCIADNSVSDYFRSTSWQILFPDLEEETITISKLINETLYILEVPSYSNTVCFVLSSSAVYNKENILKVWFFTNDKVSTQLILCKAYKCTRKDEISKDGTKVDCTQNGETCDVGDKVTANQLSEIYKFETYRLSNNVRGYFDNEQWTFLFPMLDNFQVSSIKNGSLHILKMDYISDATCYVLTDVNRLSILNNNNLIRTWVFPN